MVADATHIRPLIFFLFLCLISVFAALWLRGGTDATPFAIVESLVAGFHDHDTDRKEAIEPAPAAKIELGAQIAPSQNFSFSPTDHADHAAEDQNVCSRPRTKARSDVDTQIYYKWVDEDDQTHMSDERPVDVIASVVDLSMKKQDFTYQIRSDGVSVPVDFPGQFSAGSKRIYDTWHFFLGEKKLRQSRIEVLLIGGSDRFNAIHAKASPNSKPVNGFYRMSKNQAVVKFDPTNKEQTLRTTFHEVSHLITGSHLGPTPPWLTEGLAEYFETMEVKGQMGTIYPNQAHIKLLRKTQLPRLKNYLSIDRPEWHGADRDRNYAIAWSLMHFLLQGAPGMYAMQEVIQQAEESFCKPFSAVDALEGAYPGGLHRLEQDWRKWLSNSDFQIHQT